MDLLKHIGTPIYYNNTHTHLLVNLSLLTWVLLVNLYCISGLMLLAHFLQFVLRCSKVGRAICFKSKKNNFTNYFLKKTLKVQEECPNLFFQSPVLLRFWSFAFMHRLSVCLQFCLHFWATSNLENISYLLFVWIT